MICPDCGQDINSNELDENGYCPPCVSAYEELQAERCSCIDCQAKYRNHA